MISETNMAVCMNPPPSDSSNSKTSSYYVRCVLAPHRARRTANAYRAGMVVATSLCLLGTILWLLSSIATTTNLLDKDSSSRQSLDWLAHELQQHHHHQATNTVLVV